MGSAVETALEKIQNHDNNNDHIHLALYRGAVGRLANDIELKSQEVSTLSLALKSLGITSETMAADVVAVRKIEAQAMELDELSKGRPAIEKAKAAEEKTFAEAMEAARVAKDKIDVAQQQLANIERKEKRLATEKERLVRIYSSPAAALAELKPAPKPEPKAKNIFDRDHFPGGFVLNDVVTFADPISNKSRY